MTAVVILALVFAAFIVGMSEGYKLAERLRGKP